MSQLYGVDDAAELTAALVGSARTTPTQGSTSPAKPAGHGVPGISIATPGPPSREVISSPRSPGRTAASALLSPPRAQSPGAPQEPVATPKLSFETLREPLREPFETTPRSGVSYTSPQPRPATSETSPLPSTLAITGTGIPLSSRMAAEEAVTAAEHTTSIATLHRRQAEWDRQMEFHDQKQAELLTIQWKLVREQTGTLAKELGIVQQQLRDLKTDSRRVIVEVERFFQ